MVSAEIASGTASCFPGIGTAVSMTIDGILVAADRGTSKRKLRGEVQNDKDSKEKEIQKDSKENNKQKDSKDKNKQDEEHRNDKENEKEKKKEKVLISAMYTLSYQGKDVCRVFKLSQHFRVPQNFEIWFFNEHDSVLLDHIYVDVLFYSMLSREASLHKSNYGDCVIPSNCCEKLLSGEMCNDYKIVLLGDRTNTSMREFYFGVTKWTPKFEPKPEFVEPINEDDCDYYLLSQLICDLGRKENFGQKCILLFLCDRTDISDEQDLIEKVATWRDRVKQLVPKVPTPQDTMPKIISPEDPAVNGSRL